jgi:transposase
VRLRKTLVDQRTAWQQPIHAALFHHGLPRPDQELLSRATRAWLEGVALPPASRQALGQIDGLDPIDQWLGALARGQPGCRALMTHHDGIGPSPPRPSWPSWAPVCRRRPGGPGHRAGRHRLCLRRQAQPRAPVPPGPRGVALGADFEAAKAAARPGSPDYAYYPQVKARQGGNRATLAVARKLARRVGHSLLQLGDAALAPVHGLPLPLPEAA